MHRIEHMLRRLSPNYAAFTNAPFSYTHVAVVLPPKFVRDLLDLGVAPGVLRKARRLERTMSENCCARLDEFAHLAQQRRGHRTNLRHWLRGIGVVRSVIQPHHRPTVGVIRRKYQ